jgi:predicted metalloprotease with PDZ domain
MNAMDFALAEAGISYHIQPLDVGARLFEVICQVRQPDPEGQVFSLPAWIPGSYMIRDFARHVVALSASCQGAPIGLRKLDKATWRAAPADGELRLRAEVYAADPSVRGASLDLQQGFFNGSAVFLRVHGRERERCVVHVSPADDPSMAQWRVATTLARLTGDSYDFGAFEATDYQELIDHPVLMGEIAIAEFSAADVPHALVVAGRYSADLERVARDLATLCTWQIDFFGRPAPMTRYLFLLRLASAGFGGLEHRASSALACRPRDLVPGGKAAAGRDYRRFLGLASHEYFHLWNVKRIRPAELDACNLEREAYTRQLWIFEGITSYYDDLALLRSGLVTAPEYLELLGRTLTQVYRSTGRRRQTLEEASFDAWIKFYRPDENTPNAHVSYYAKGAMVALALDLEIRLRTEGKRSLDDVMRLLWQTHGRDSGQALPEGAFEELAGEVTGLDLADFFRQNVRGTVDPPVGILLAQFGVRLQLRPAESESDAGGAPGQREDRPRPWLGIRTRSVEGRLRITHVLEGSPAQRTGLNADDEVLALNGWRVDPESFPQLLDRVAIGDRLELHLFRDDSLVQVAMQAAEPPRDTCYLAIDETAADSTLARRRAWLAPARR